MTFVLEVYAPKFLSWPQRIDHKMVYNGVCLGNGRGIFKQIIF